MGEPQKGDDGFSFENAAPADGFGAFEFTFDNFPPPEQIGAKTDDLAFVFDAENDEPETNREEELFSKFSQLLKSPCFENPRSLVDLFRQIDPTESVDASFEVLMN